MAHEGERAVQSHIIAAVCGAVETGDALEMVYVVKLELHRVVAW